MLFKITKTCAWSKRRLKLSLTTKLQSWHEKTNKPARRGKQEEGNFQWISSSNKSAWETCELVAIDNLILCNRSISKSSIINFKSAKSFTKLINKAVIVLTMSTQKCNEKSLHDMWLFMKSQRKFVDVESRIGRAGIIEGLWHFHSPDQSTARVASRAWRGPCRCYC